MVTIRDEVNSTFSRTQRRGTDLYLNKIVFFLGWVLFMLLTLSLQFTLLKLGVFAAGVVVGYWLLFHSSSEDRSFLTQLCHVIGISVIVFAVWYVTSKACIEEAGTTQWITSEGMNKEFQKIHDVFLKRKSKITIDLFWIVLGIIIAVLLSKKNILSRYCTKMIVIPALFLYYVLFLECGNLVIPFLFVLMTTAFVFADSFSVIADRQVSTSTGAWFLGISFLIFFSILVASERSYLLIRTNIAEYVIAYQMIMSVRFIVFLIALMAAVYFSYRNVGLEKETFFFLFLLCASLLIRIGVQWYVGYWWAIFAVYAGIMFFFNQYSWPSLSRKSKYRGLSTWILPIVITIGFMLLIIEAHYGRIYCGLVETIAVIVIYQAVLVILSEWSSNKKSGLKKNESLWFKKAGSFLIIIIAVTIVTAVRLMHQSKSMFSFALLFAIALMSVGCVLIMSYNPGIVTDKIPSSLLPVCLCSVLCIIICLHMKIPVHLTEFTNTDSQITVDISIDNKDLDINSVKCFWTPNYTSGLYKNTLGIPKTYPVESFEDKIPDGRGGSVNETKKWESDHFVSVESVNDGFLKVVTVDSDGVKTTVGRWFHNTNARRIYK